MFCTNSATYLCPEKHQANYRDRGNWDRLQLKEKKTCIEWSITLMVLLHNIRNNTFDFVSFGRIEHRW